jgi:hypothetical protein
MHPSIRIAFRHFLMDDTSPGCHPLDVAGSDHTMIAHAVTMFYRAGQHIGDRFDPSMGMPGKTCQVIIRIFIPEVIEQKKWIKLRGVAKSKGTTEMYPGTFKEGFGLN